MGDVSSVANRGGVAPRKARVCTRAGWPSCDTRDRLKARSACRTDTSTCSGYENARAGIDAGVQRIRQVGQGVEGREPFRRGSEAALAFRICIEGSHHALQIDSAGRKLITRHRSVNRCACDFSSAGAGCSAPVRSIDRPRRRRRMCRGACAVAVGAHASKQRRGFARDVRVRAQAPRRFARSACRAHASSLRWTSGACARCDAGASEARFACAATCRLREMRAAKTTSAACAADVGVRFEARALSSRPRSRSARRTRPGRAVRRARKGRRPAPRRSSRRRRRLH